ncbi:MAG: carboxypeptidase regulatory-like domain-containing protein [Nitrososphaerota archaeon]|nr:carboxypeptidase regulatory-like domain-containing protein [Nitrososphaerota archaeon]
MVRRSAVSRAWALLVVGLLAVGVAATVVLYAFQATPASQTSPYAHIGRATIALVAPDSVLAADPGFPKLAEKYYRFVYADAANFSAVESASFMAIALTTPPSAAYRSIASPYLNGSRLAYALKTGGSTYSYRGVGRRNQTVFVLAGYSRSGLSAALNAFFVRRPVVLPRESLVNVTLVNGTVSDPVLEANYGGYLLDPSDPYFNSSSAYSYYLNFASVFYQAPWEIEIEHGGTKVTEEYTFSWNGSGFQLPHGSQLCFDFARPSICWGIYSAVPIFSFAQGVTQQPKIELDTQDCSVLFYHCIGNKGTVLSGYSTTYGPGYLAGERFYAQLLQQYNVATNLTTIKQLLEAGVVTYSTGLPSESACSYSSCSSLIDFPIGIYPLVTAYSNIEGLDATFGSRYNYTALFEPLTLSTPALYTNKTGTYAFVQWVVNSQVGNDTHQQTFDSANSTLEIVGPTQAEAVYTPYNPPKPGLLTGKVEFYHTYGNNITGLPIQGATVVVSQNGKSVFRTTSGVDGTYASPSILQPGCYNITAYRQGYNLQPESNPVCIDGNEVDNVYERYFFWAQAYGPAGFGQGITAGSSVQLYFEIFWPDGSPVANWPITGSVNSGSVTFQSLTDANGIATFKWTGGTTPGDFNASFSTQGLGTRPLFYSMPAAVFPNSYSLFRVNASVPTGPYIALQNSTIVVPVALSSCTLVYPNTGRYAFECDPFQPLHTTLSVTGLPPGAISTFTPNPAARLSNFNITIPSGVAPGIYTVTVNESGAPPPGYYLPPVTNTTSFTLKIESCTNGTGEITGEVLNPDGGLPMDANITVYGNGAKMYSANTTTGLFSTGYILQPGTYNVTAYNGYTGKIYHSELVSVSACGQTKVTLTFMAALTIEVSYNGSPAPFANITITQQSGFFREFKTNSTGGYSSGHTLMPGTYIITASFNGYSATSTVTLAADATTRLSFSLPDPPPLAVPRSWWNGLGQALG